MRATIADPGCEGEEAEAESTAQPTSECSCQEGSVSGILRCCLRRRAVEIKGNIRDVLCEWRRGRWHIVANVERERTRQVRNPRIVTTMLAVVAGEARRAAARIALALKVAARAAVLARVFGQALMTPAAAKEESVKINGRAIDQASVAVAAYRRAEARCHNGILSQAGLERWPTVRRGKGKARTGHVSIHRGITGFRYDAWSLMLPKARWCAKEFA